MPEGRHRRQLVVPHPEYVKFATHFGFKADFCEGAAPESKGVVENLCGYVQRDLLIPALFEPEWPDLAAANAAACAWCAEVNSQVHSEICAVPNERLASERQMLRPLPLGRPPLRAAETRTVDKRGSIRLGPRGIWCRKGWSASASKWWPMKSRWSSAMPVRRWSAMIRSVRVRWPSATWPIRMGDPHAAFVRERQPSSPSWASVQPRRPSCAQRPPRAAAAGA